jgi:K+-sensing histidine kinase KdpD
MPQGLIHEYRRGRASHPQTWKGRYGVALLMVAIGTIGVGTCMALIAQPMFVLYVVLIAQATGLGGIGSGLVAAVLALLASNYFFLPPTSV